METPKPVANIFATRVLNRRADMAPPSSSVAPSSSPAFGTPAHPIKPFGAGAGAVNKQTGGGTAAPTTTATILPILLPPATLRPVAFRTFTKKHGLTLTSAALQELATFIGRHCGVGWREEGLAERVLEEAARAWKARSGGVIVDVGGAAGNELKEILRALEGNMVGGKVVGTARGLGRQNSLVFDGVVDAAEQTKTRLGIRPSAPSREDSQASIGMSGLDVDDDLDEEVADPRQWLKVINAYDQPRLIYDATKKHFERYMARTSSSLVLDTLD